MAVVNKPRPQGTPLDSGYTLGLGLFTAINPWDCAITILTCWDSELDGKSVPPPTALTLQ